MNFITARKYISIVFIVSVFILSGCSVHRQPGPTDIQKRAKLLDAYYLKAVQGKEKAKYERLFFDLFPDTFSELESIYGYDSEKGESPLYDKSYQHIHGLFNQLKSAPSKEYYSKIIHIAVGGRWDADAVNFFQAGLQDRVRQNPELVFSIVDELSDKEAESFFFFLFHAAHPIWDEIPDKLKKASGKFQRMQRLMSKGFYRALEESGH